MELRGTRSKILGLTKASMRNILSLPFERENEFDILEIVNTMKSHRNELKNSKLIKET